MRKIFPLCLAFGLGLFCHRLIPQARADNPTRVTGIGGIFFKSADPAALKKWYSQHLGLSMDKHGHMFKWQTVDSKPGLTQWSIFPTKTDYFEPSSSSFMINYRVANLESLVVTLRSEGVTVLDKVDVQSYGRFVHILDPDGNKIELWEPPAP